MNETTGGPVKLVTKFRTALLVGAMAAMLFSIACGSDSHQATNAGKYPTGISDDIEQQLKYDARVDGFEQDGENLIVNVNEAWPNSPPGMRERALGQWYGLWRTTHSASSKIVVKHEGNELDTWTADKGYQPAGGEKERASEG
jgi:hypothetical protein